MTELSIYVKEKRKEYGLTQVNLSQKSGVGVFQIVVLFVN